MVLSIDILSPFTYIKWMSYTKFVITSEGRTGSNYLMYLLRSHVNILLYTELFNRNDPKVLEYLKTERRLIQNDEDPKRYLEEEVFANYQPNIKCVGFKLMYYQARTKNWSSLWDYIRDQKDIKIVHMIRKNPLDRYLSLQLARRDNIYISFDKSRGIHKEPIFIDPDDFELKTKHSLKERNDIKNFFKNSDTIEIAYEDLLDNKDKTCSKLLEYLKLPYRNLISGTLRQRQKNQKDMILNYDELKKKFIGTNFTKFFTD